MKDQGKGMVFLLKTSRKVWEQRKDTREGSPMREFEKVQSRTQTIEKEGPVWPLVPSLEALFEMALPIV